MKKFVLALLALPLFTLTAKADEVVSAESLAPNGYTCTLSGSMKGNSIAIGFGGEIIKGRGTLSCDNTSTGRHLNIPVRLSLVGGGAGFEFSRIHRMTVRTAGVRVSDPSAFYRSFGLGATAGGTLVKAGIGFDAAFRVNGDAKGPGFEVGLSGQDARGLGVHLYAMTFKIKRI